MSLNLMTLGKPDQLQDIKIFQIIWDFSEAHVKKMVFTTFSLCSQTVWNPLNITINLESKNKNKTKQMFSKVCQ